MHSLSDVETQALDTDLEGAVARMEAKRKRGDEPRFAIKSNLFQFRAAKTEERKGRVGIRKLIRPENARELLKHLPKTPADRTHCVLRGDFVLCDIIPLIIRARGRCPCLKIATLGMSTANAETIAKLIEKGDVGSATVVVSEYFRQLDKTTTFREVSARLKGCARLIVKRSHAKVILLPTESGDSYVFEGSANIRSSDNLEQMTIVNDPETIAFHTAWMEELAETP